VIPDQERQFPLFREHGPIIFLLIFFLLVVVCATFSLRNCVVVNLALVRILVVAELVSRMINAHHAAPDRRSS